MSTDLRDQARRLIDARVIVAFIAGMVVYQLWLMLWQLIVPVVFVVGGCWLLMRVLFPDHSRK